MKRFVLIIVVAMFAISTAAWAYAPPPSLEDWENYAGYPGPIHQQTSGSGWANWNNNYWNGVNQADKHADVVQPDVNKFLAVYGTSTTGGSRNFNEYLQKSSTLGVSFDYTIVGSFTGDATIYISNLSSNDCQLEWKADGTKKINYRGAVTTLLGYWDGRNADGTPNSDLNFSDSWRRVCMAINVPAKTWGLTVVNPDTGHKTVLFTAKATRTAHESIDHFRFLGGKTGYNDWDYGYTGIDNIVITPEPSSLLALATGFVGLAGVVIRRRR